jgi:SAM-dependent methyltransferase
VRGTTRSHDLSKQASWNERYAASDLVWGADPNRFVAEAFGDVAARGRALDLGCGEGRNAIWLAERGWRVTGVDYAEVAIDRARRLASARGVEVSFVEADVTSWRPEAEAYALVIVAYLQLPPADLRRVWACAVGALAPGGELFAVGHAVRNLAEGTGGPPDSHVLWDAGTIAAELRALGLELDEATEVTRAVEGAPRPAIDARIRAHRG